MSGWYSAQVISGAGCVSLSRSATTVNRVETGRHQRECKDREYRPEWFELSCEAGAHANCDKKNRTHAAERRQESRYNSTQ
jgi:hypothetical protein